MTLKALELEKIDTNLYVLMFETKNTLYEVTLNSSELESIMKMIETQLHDDWIEEYGLD